METRLEERNGVMEQLFAQEAERLEAKRRDIDRRGLRRVAADGRILATKRQGKLLRLSGVLPDASAR
ncbi:hypothetical protein [Streptomyces sp. RerS4]|uniref:hypothetical protein n=1 Tax=Streptomyces sp. RerS4 TaxID=2942449 RepID=UPI00201C7920|nr:hypothetical protein [Streptomyces sp. RerS4]UQW99345.1 hypothetical protein M4D82_01485 [Streptomyces sp. RerS4]